MLYRFIFLIIRRLLKRDRQRRGTIAPTRWPILLNIHCKMSMTNWMMSSTIPITPRIILAMKSTMESTILSNYGNRQSCCSPCLVRQNFRPVCRSYFGQDAPHSEINAGSWSHQRRLPLWFCDSLREPKTKILEGYVFYSGVRIFLLILCSMNEYSR